MSVCWRELRRYKCFTWYCTSARGGSLVRWVPEPDLFWIWHQQHRSIYSKFHIIWAKGHELVFRLSWQFFKKSCFYLTILYVSLFVDKYNSPFISVSVAWIVMLLWTALNPVYIILSWLQCHCLARIEIHTRIQPTTTYYIQPQYVVNALPYQTKKTQFTIHPFVVLCKSLIHQARHTTAVDLQTMFFSILSWESVCALLQCLLAFKPVYLMSIKKH